ncbi:MAG TPA: hypothetical protein VGS07_09225 [Thermoanaerobaculia bacterium]|jgi:hypothetical protein|nr:hypothetical protein [Thermoanaerobaculia bacterium]
MEFKINIGYTTEDEVQRAVEHAFSPDFVFRAPRREDGKEVTDVLVPWDDTALVIQAKSQAIPGDGSLAGDPLKWARKNLLKAGRQVAGAVRAIQSGRMSHIENPRQGRVPFSTSRVKWLYGLIVLHHVCEPYNPFELVPELCQIKSPMHIISFSDFLSLTRLLDTPADLIGYLESRSDVLLPTLTPKIHEESTAFSYYLNNLERIMALRACKREMYFTEEDARPYAEQMRRLFSGDMPGPALGYIIDEIIEKCHERDPSLAPIRRGAQLIAAAPDSYVKIATELGKIPRIRRIALGKRYIRTIRLAEEQQADSWKATYSRKRSDCMLFLASPLPASERSVRGERLIIMTEAYKHYRQVRRAIGIATEAGHDSGRSYDFVYADYEPMENDEAFQAAKELFGEDGGLLTEDPQ